jgi:spermidine/putrescine transport system ATP-binding protein
VASLSNGRDVEVDVAGLGHAMIAPDQCPGGLTAGQASVGIRPETMSILFEGDPGTGKVAESEVVEVTYFGDMTYYDVRLDGIEKPLQLSMKNVTGRPVLERGDRARVSWDPRSLVLFC